jgi:site-specific DNA recombinase
LHGLGILRHRQASGEQPPIMERALFDAVQQKLTDQWTARTSIRTAGDHLLTGLLFDDAGHRMAPTHATNVSLPCLHGETKTAKVGSVTRVGHLRLLSSASAISR